MNAEGRYIIGLVRDHPRTRAAAQRAEMAKIPADRIVDNHDSLLKDIRTTDIVAVTQAFLLAQPPKRKAPGNMRREFYRVLDEIEAAGGEVWELSTDRRTSDGKTREAIIRDAIDTLSRVRAHTAVGRPPRDWPQAQIEIIKKHWFSRLHENNAAACVAMAADGVKITASQAAKLLGPSGRVAGNPLHRKMRAEWREVPDFPKYEAHTDGRIRSASTRRVLRPRYLPTGYGRVSLGKAHEFYIHDVVLRTFVGPRPEGKQASHCNGNNRDNRLSNLAWETPSENNQRKTEHGTQLFGKRNPMGKKTECKRGHPFTKANTRMANGKRVCRTCQRDWMRIRRAAKR